jgi:hypothetical protein
MASLTAHLRQPSDHGRLEFHPACPLCHDERLAGTLPADALIGHRTKALLAAGVLAVTTAAPTAVFAAEPDQQQEGTTAPDQVPVDATPSDPGGGADELPFDVGPEAQAAPEHTDDTGPLEQEPVTNEGAPTADPGDGTGTRGAGSQQARAEDAAPTPASQPPSEPEPSATAPETPAPTAPQAPAGSPPSVPLPETAVEPYIDTTAAPRARERETARNRTPRTHPTAPQIVRAAPAPQPPAAPASTTFQAAAPVPAATDHAVVSRGREAKQGDRFHVVAPNESLWSIARDLLGDGASTARIAREVNRLWELNSARIGTGDPDLLIVGTRLALR